MTDAPMRLRSTDGRRAEDDRPRARRRHRRLAAPGGVRGDGRPRLQLRADRRGGRRASAPTTTPRSCSPGSQGWPRARSRWQRGSTRRWPARPSTPRPRSRSSGARSSSSRGRSRPSSPRCTSTAASTRSWRWRSPSRCTPTPSLALEVHTREELGVDADHLPSPMVAAGSSFVSFAVGASIPVLPYLFGAETLWLAMVLSLVALFACGAVVSRVTTRTWWYGGSAPARPRRRGRRAHLLHRRPRRRLPRLSRARRRWARQTRRWALIEWRIARHRHVRPDRGRG